MLLRSPPISRVEEVVRTVDVSLQSELAIIREFARIAERMGRVHDIILMIDLGDLREGIWPSDLLTTVEQILDMKGVRIAGVGTNLGCFGAILPTEENPASSWRMPIRSNASPAASSISFRWRIVDAAAASRGRPAGRHQQPAGGRGDPSGWA